MTARGIVIAAPASGSGKTLVSLGLMAALKRRNVAVAAAKVGPDYIDPAFHAVAVGRPGTNLDGWAMDVSLLAARVARACDGAEIVVCEGVMGLLDGAHVGLGQRDGSTAQIAAFTGWPVVLVVDAARMAGSAAAIVSGFASVSNVAGVIFNRVGSDRHRAMILQAMQIHCPKVAVLGFLPQLAALAVPSRHLGLVQAQEHPDLLAFIDSAAQLVERHVDVEGAVALSKPAKIGGSTSTALRPLGQRIAVARDLAFAFVYDDLLMDWKQQGAEISFFSPLDDQQPLSGCDAVYLPGGYPELSVERLAANEQFKAGLRQAAAQGAFVYGECGGYMMLGQGIVDPQGKTHEMVGLLPVVTSMEKPKRQLGYRRATLVAETRLGQAGTTFRGHEFHYAVEITRQERELFQVSTADGGDLCAAGCQLNSVIGSFVHLISAVSMD